MTTPSLSVELDGLTSQLASHVTSIRYGDLPPRATEMAHVVIADAMACGLAGSTIAPEVVNPLRAVAPIAHEGTTTSLLHEAACDPMTAALVNATTIHTIDYDDTHMAVVSHFGASVVAASLAAVERVGAGGARLVEAVVAGFEAGARVGRACMPQHYQRWHATSSLGGLAAAAAAARAMGLDASGTEMALGLAADDTGGTRVAIAQGDISKSLHAGTAAHKGVRSAMLVAAGATGPLGHLEHEYGFFWAYSDERDARRLPEQLRDLGQRWEILEDDIKAHPCILSSHTAIEAVIAIATEHDLQPEDVTRIELIQPPYSRNHGMNLEPTTAMAARLSVPYCVTVALRDRRVGLAQFADDRWLDHDIRREMVRVTLTTDDTLRDRYPGQAPTRTRIHTHDGDVHEREIGVAHGSHQRPLTQRQLRDKHDELIARRLSPSQREVWHRTIRDLTVGTNFDTWRSLLRLAPEAFHD